MTTQETISALLSSLGVTITASAPTVNDELQFQFAIQVSRNGKEFYSGPYSMGYGHVRIPDTHQGFRKAGVSLRDPRQDSFSAALCKPGFKDLKNFRDQGKVRSILATLAYHQKLAPSLTDVMHSLLLDAQCGDNSFKGFCAELGYDDDSISAKETWEACNKTHYALRGVFTTEERAKLEDAFQDY